MKLLLASLIASAAVWAQAPSASPASPLALTEDWLSGSFELGYRWVSTGGDFDAYRSIVNLGEGPRLVNADFTLRPRTHKFFDRADIQLTSWGGDPYNTARADIRKEGVYRLTVGYRNISYFNFLPSFANPLLGQPGSADWNSFDTHIRTYDAQLDLLPNRRITPYLAFSRNTQFGRGISDFYSDANQYAVATLFSTQTNNYRGGVNVDLRRLHLTLEEGGTTFKDDQGLSDSEPNPGYSLNSLLGQNLVLNSLDTAYRVRGDSTYSKALIAADLAPWISLSGDFVFAQPTTNTQFSQTASGNLFLASLLQFYSTGQDLLTADATAPHTTGSFSVELRPLPRLRVVESWFTDRLHNAAGSLLTEALLTGTSTLNLSDLESSRLTMNYSQQELDLFYDLTSHITLRGGYRYVWGDSTVVGPILSGLPFETGNLRRNVGIGGVTFKLAQKLRVSGDFEGASSDQVYYRASLRNYEKAHLRASYDPAPSLRISADFSLLKNNDPDPNVRLDFTNLAASAQAFWMPKGGKNFNLLLDYTRSEVRSDILYLIPELLQPTFSYYREFGHNGTAVATVRWFHLGGSFFKSSGSRPTEYYQPRAGVSAPLNKHLQWNLDWRWYGFAEKYYAYEGFHAHELMTSLRFTR